MRKIKFRVWDLNDNMMYEVSELLLVENGFDWRAKGDHAISGWRGNGKLMQYTGLKDKNGVEIYEGDMVNGFSGVGVVEYLTNLNWDSGGSLHAGFWCKEWFDYGGEGEMSYHDGFGNCEVIGNIWEDPNLLKGEK